jgi:hypothetical protein
MESDTGNREGVICWLCSEETAHFFGEVYGRTIALCPGCEAEFNEAREKTEYDFKRRYERSLLRWLTGRRTVKRFDKAQHRLRFEERR